MVKKSNKQKSIKCPKRAKVEVHHYQKPRRLVTLEEFLLSSFDTKSTQGNVEASCFNVDKGQTMKVPPTVKEVTTSESSPKVSPGEEEKESREISEMMSLSSSEKSIELSSQEAHVCDTKITFTDNDLLFGEILHNRPLYMVGHVLEKKINRILIDEGSKVNILPIHTLKELGITTGELSESRLLIQGFNQGAQRSIGSMKLEIHMGDLRSSAWMHVIDAKTSYNILLVAYDSPFTEVETHFADAKFFMRSYVVKGIKSNDVKLIKIDNIISKRIDAAIEKRKIDTKDSCPILNEVKILSSKKKQTSRLCYVPKEKEKQDQPSNLEENTLRGLTFPIRRIDATNLSAKLPEKSVAQDQVLDMDLPTKHTREGFDPNAYKLFVKAAYNPSEPSTLEKLPSEDTTRKAREGLGYSQPPPIHISIRRASNNDITFEDDVTSPNKRTSVFDPLGEATTRISVFERLGPLKKNNMNLRSYLKVTKPTSHLIRKDLRSLIPTRMRRRVELMVSYKEKLKAKIHIVVYTKEREEDEESVGSSNHVTIQNEYDSLPQKKIDKEVEDIVSCCHISVNYSDLVEEEDAKYAPPELEKGVKITIDPLKEVNLDTDEDPKPTYLSAFLEIDEEVAYMNILKEYRDVFAWRFIREVKYPTWISSIVPVRKKNGQIRVYVEFRDLNNACLKDEFPLPIPELMIDDTTGYEAMSFMDGSSGYNQIRMSPKDEEITAFRTPKGYAKYL
ncbi:uncharacterized protein [Solanum lycopersicum]|uniref:uncharacterized protein n=1 Tax=Solanum lycopersicum TaxID=4081 RepID=UPI003749D007